MARQRRDDLYMRIKLLKYAIEESNSRKTSLINWLYGPNNETKLIEKKLFVAIEIKQLH